MTRTFGPDYDDELDGPRISKQHEAIRDFMLRVDDWKTLAEIECRLGYPQASISAQLRHLRKERFGGHIVEKRRRHSEGGTWEYRVTQPVDEDGQILLGLFQ